MKVKVQITGVLEIGNLDDYKEVGADTPEKVFQYIWDSCSADEVIGDMMKDLKMEVKETE